MKRGTIISALILVLSVLIITLVSSEKSLTLHKDSAIQKVIDYKTALAEKERTESAERERIYRVLDQYGNTFTMAELPCQKNDYGLDVWDQLIQACKKVPLITVYHRYPQCGDVGCVLESFIFDRVEKNRKLKNAVKLTKEYGIRIYLWDKFDVRNTYIDIDVNADDQTIINFLTIDSNIIKKK